MSSAPIGRRSLPARAGRTLLFVALLLGAFLPSVSAVAAPCSLAADHLVTTVGAKKPTPKSIPHYTFGIEPIVGHELTGHDFLSYATSAGARITDHVAVLDFSYTPLTLYLYPADATDTTQGGFTVLTRFQHSVQVGVWTTFGSGAHHLVVHVPARKANHVGFVILTIHIHVPSNATPGDHAGGIIASLASYGKNKAGDRIVVYQQTGARVYLRVAGVLRPQLTIEHLHASYRGTLNAAGEGVAVVRYSVVNTGNLLLGGRQLVRVSGLFGSKEQLAPGSISLLLPGGSVTETVRVPGVFPEFYMHASVTIYPLIQQGDVDPGLAASYSASTSFWAIPWVIVLIIVLLILAFIGRRRWRGRRRATAATTDPVPVG
jgi:hypothetical protein